MIFKKTVTVKGNEKMPRERGIRMKRKLNETILFGCLQAALVLLYAEREIQYANQQQG